MTDLQLRELDGRGLAFVRENLAEMNSLCSALLEIVQGSSGRAWTLVPPDTSEERLYQFDRSCLLASNRDMSRAVAVPEGGVLMEVDSLHLERAERVLDTLGRIPGSICIIDDVLPTWGDGFHVPEPTAFGVGDEVYHLATGIETPDEMADLLALGDANYHGVSAVCSPPMTLTRTTLSSPETLNECARSVVEITFSAYRGEGFVVWSRGVFQR